MSDFVVVIPARYASERLPGKPLCDIAGKPMIQHVFERATESIANKVIIATDDERIAAVAASFGADCCMTPVTHRSGTERLADVARQRDFSPDTVVVNLQGDEPLLPAGLINQCATLLDDDQVDVATLAAELRSQEDFLNPNIVKVLIDNSGRALYFSRAAIPFARDPDKQARAQKAALHHLGIYAYRNRALQQIVASEPSELEMAEKLEQLRFLQLGLTIRVGLAAERPGPGVDTEDDLARAAALIEAAG